jgi:L-iditol 2-dehydrogenase
MKAVIVKSPGKIEISEIPDPVMGEYDVLCETLAAAVCSGTDNHIVEGHPYFVEAYPLVLGHEGIGRVVARGDKVRNIKVGDIVTRVFNKLPEGSGFHLREGAFAEKTIATDWEAMRDDGIDVEAWHNNRVHRVLEGDADPVASTMIITWRETLSFLYRVEPKKGDRILIIGSGANALAFSEHLYNMECDITVIGSEQREKEFIMGGINVFVSYKDEGYLSDSHFDDFDIIIDCIGNSKNVEKVLSTLVRNGKIALYGLDDFGNYCINPTLARGDFVFFNGEKYDEAAAHDEVMSHILDKKLNHDLYLDEDHVYGMEDVEKALDATKNRQVLKSVIKFY